MRSLRRRLRYTAVNVLGLTVGLACCALITVFLQYELSYDRHHADAERIYRIVTDFGDDAFSSIRFVNYNGSTPDEQRALATRLPETISAVEQATNFEILDRPLFVETPSGDRFESGRQLVTNTGAAFADLFTFERVAGAPLSDALSDPGSVVLTTATAETYFGPQDPIGQTLQVGSSTTATVTAVIAEPPSNSRITFDLALRVEQIPNWAAYHYVRLAPGADVEAVRQQISEVMDEVNPRRVKERREGETVEQVLQPLSAIHLAERTLYDDTPHRNPAYLWAFGAIGLLILGITIINYANLALALYADRNAEIGVRKALGGHREQIAGQFLAEAALLSVACVPLAVAACAAVLPAFNALMDTGIALSRVLDPVVLGTLAGLALAAGLVAGGYPAFVLARKQAVELFGRGRSTGGRRGGSLRHALIGLQFVVLIALGSLSWIVNDQLDFMQNSDLGYRTDNVVQLRSVSADSAQYQRLKVRLLDAPSIAAVGVGASPRERQNRGPCGVTGLPVDYSGCDYQRVDPSWFEVVGIEHPALQRIRETGMNAPEQVLVNEAFVEMMSAEIESPVGRGMLNVPDDPPETAPPIVGVVPNLLINSMQFEVSPTHYHVFAAPPYAYQPLLRLAAGQTEEGLAHARNVVQALFPDTPLRVAFLDETVAELYEQERRFGILGTVLTGLAVFLAALGLASLVAYLTRLRMKEIGIRRALGGTVASIVALFNREYVQIVGAAFVVGAPLAWWAGRSWLDQFAYQTGLSPWTFVVTGLGAGLVAMAAVSIQAIQAARADPAEVLRSE